MCPFPSCIISFLSMWRSHFFLYSYHQAIFLSSALFSSTFSPLPSILWNFQSSFLKHKWCFPHECSLLESNSSSVPLLPPTSSPFSSSNFGFLKQVHPLHSCPPHLWTHSKSQLNFLRAKMTGLHSNMQALYLHLQVCFSGFIFDHSLLSQTQPHKWIYVYYGIYLTLLIKWVYSCLN